MVDWALKSNFLPPFPYVNSFSSQIYKLNLYTHIESNRLYIYTMISDW